MVGGGGSIQAMQNSLRNNKALLRRKKLFEKTDSFLGRDKDELKSSYGKFSGKQATPSQIKNIRRKVLEDNKKQERIKIQLWSFVCVVVVLLLVHQYYFTDKQDQVNYVALTHNAEKLETDYLFYVTDGDKWFKKKNWYNAIYQYKKSLEIYPDNYDAKLKLLKAYTYSCKYKSQNCDTGKLLLEDMLLLLQNDDEKRLIKTERLFNQVYSEKCK